MCVRKPGRGDALLRGLAQPLVAIIGKAGLVVAGGRGNKTGEFQDHLGTSSKCQAKDQEAENGSTKIGNGHGMQPSKENIVVPKEINLSGVLDSLMSLDSKGDFMGPLDGFSASNISKAPMCFAMMQEKIRTQQYSSWRMFVEDFELMCNNALRWNYKRNYIWTAAEILLRRGKKCLEQYEGCGENLIALNNASLDSKLGIPSKSKPQSVEAKVCQHNSSIVSKELKMAIPSATTGSAESKPPSSGADSLCKDGPVGKTTSLIQLSKEENQEDQMTRNATPVLDVVSEETPTEKDALKANVSMDVRGVESRRRVSGVGFQPCNSSSAVRQTDEDVDVEEEGDVESEDYRFDADGEATESSSYDSAGSAFEGEASSERMESMFEVESDLRDGNGAVGLLEEDDGLFTSERGKKQLDGDWKQHRRGIEWRCHWLELRKKAIKAKLSQYDRMLETAQSEKIWKWEGDVGEGTSARTVPVEILRNHPIIRRKHRRRAEDEDLDLGKHPVFSRYGKKKTQRKSDDGLPLGKVDGYQGIQREFTVSEPVVAFEKEDVEQQLAGDSAFVGQDSMEQVLWQVEALQARVKKQRHLLRKEVAARKHNTPVSKAGVSNLSPRTLPHGPQRGTSPQVLPSQKSVSRGGPPSSSSAGVGRTNAGLARRKASDYDINNIVMPVNVGGTFVEQVRHVDIETPLWRLTEDAKSSLHCSQESSSDEETEDEHYQNRHAIMEVLERQQRCMLPLKRSAGEMQTVGKGKLKLGIGKSAVKMTGKGSSASLILPSSSAPFGTDVVPKRQRSNRNTARRTPVPLFDPSAAQARSPEAILVKSDGVVKARAMVVKSGAVVVKSEVVVVKPEVKSEVLAEDADASLPVVESRNITPPVVESRNIIPLVVGSGEAAVTIAEKTPTLDPMEEG